MVKIAVLGANGRLGSELVKNGCIPIISRLGDNKLASELNSISPDVVVNCAGKTDVDGCERDVINSYLNNAFYLENLAKGYGGFIVQISTDFVFDGNAGPYDELAAENPIQTYGFSKFVAETIIKRFFKDYLIIRTTNLYDAGKTNKSNFALWVINALKSQKQIKVSDEFWGNPTYVPHLAIGILRAIQARLTGTLNIVGETYCTRYEFAQAIAKFFNLDANLIVKGTFFADAKRPLRAGLKTDIARAFGIPIFDLSAGLDGLRLELENVQS